jgi:hypothetical protein
MDAKFRVPIFENKIYLIVTSDRRMADVESAKFLKVDVETLDENTVSAVASSGTAHVIWFRDSIFRLDASAWDIITHETRHLADDVLTAVGHKIRSGGEAEAYMQGWLAKKIFNLIKGQTTKPKDGV